MKRITMIVMDSLGVGALPDAEQYGDQGADTLGHILDHNPQLKIPNLRKLGLGNIDGAAAGRLSFSGGTEGCFGRFAEKSAGKDTITGHWEIAGLITQVPFKTYPEGFPQEFIDAFEHAIGVKVLGNCTASGTEIIQELGPEHEASGKPIVYTSADSVFQIAANTEVIPLERLYEFCETARELLTGDWACGRVIARPYVLEDGKRIRTSDRKDYAVSPPQPTVLEAIASAGKQVYAVGKISDIFNGQGITQSVHTKNNMDGVDHTIQAMKQEFEGLIFTNLVDFDSQFGHRRDPHGYGKALEEFDERIPELLEALKEEEALILCADHGNDPVHHGWDHTREYIPFLIYGKEVKRGINLGTGKGFSDIGATICDLLDVSWEGAGDCFRTQIKP